MSAMYDIEVLNDLQQLLEGDFIELIEIYVRDVNKNVPQLAQLAQSNDLERLMKVAHSLKGASINLGVGLFGEQCALIEQAARNGATSDIGPLVKRAQELSTDLVHELSSLFLK